MYRRKQKKNRERIIEKREKSGKPNKGQIGRGSLLTFLSKNFVNKVIQIIGAYGRNKILTDIHNSIIFSLMVDTTQDVAVMDQLTICFRYVLEGAVYERFLNVTIVEDTSGAALFEHIQTELSNLGISISKIVACSFDGASNMKGCYNGLQAHLKEANPKVVFTHCMGHVLNLVLMDSTFNILEAENLFGLVEESAVFFDASCKRTSIWQNETKKEHKGQEKLRKLHTIGATRWWSKHKALLGIIDEEFLVDVNKNSKLIHVIRVLLEISNGSFDCKTKFMARNLISQWSKFENIFMAFIFLDIFLATSPVSKFLQSKEIDYATAWNLIQNLLEQISDKRNDNSFDFIYKKTKDYANIVNNYFDETTGIEIELDFTEKRVSKKKKMPGEKAPDESNKISSSHKYKIIYFKIIDCIQSSIKERFVPNEGILKDCSWLNPKKFKDIAKIKQFQSDELKSIATLSNVDRSTLIVELRQFATQYPSLVKVEKDKVLRNKTDLNFDGLAETEDLDNIEHCSMLKKCFECLSCAFPIIHELSQSGLFTNLYVAYKYVLTLPSTQVTCERVFSKLKIIKNRLRSNLQEELLSDFLLMNIERDIFSDLDKNLIVDKIGESSQELRKKLLI